MGIARSTFYDLPLALHDDAAIVEAIAAICDEFEFYGWRRGRAELRHRGMIVNHKPPARARSAAGNPPTLCRNNRQRSRSAALPQSDHRRDCRPTRPAVGRRHRLCRDRSWLRLRRRDPRRWSRRVVGYAISRSIDARLTIAALKSAIEQRKPSPGCMHHSDPGSQYAAERYRHLFR
jgi:putative transposase